MELLQERRGEEERKGEERREEETERKGINVVTQKIRQKMGR